MSIADLIETGGPIARPSTRMEKVGMVLKDTFDPLNMASALMGRSKIGTALLGSLFGRSGADIKRITSGKKRSSDYTTLSSVGSGGVSPGDSLADIATKIYGLMAKSLEEDRETEKVRIELELGRQKLLDARNEALISALLGEGRLEIKGLKKAHIRRKKAIPKEGKKKSRVEKAIDSFGLLGLVAIGASIPTLIKELHEPEFVKDIEGFTKDIVSKVEIPSLKDALDMFSEMKLPSMSEILDGLKEGAKETYAFVEETGKAAIAIGKGIKEGIEKRQEYKESKKLLPNITPNAKKALEFFIDKGWTPEQAAGIVGNLQAESTDAINPNATNPKNGMYGIAQWDTKRREDFKQIIGRDIKGSTLEQQLEFLDWELKHKEKFAGEKLKQTKTPQEAAIIFEKHYERANQELLDRRISRAGSLLAPEPVEASMVPIPQEPKGETFYNADKEYREYQDQMEEARKSVSVISLNTTNNNVIKERSMVPMAYRPNVTPPLMEIAQG